MPSGVTVSRRIGLSADASPPGCGDARAAFRAALAAAPWQHSPGSRFVRLRSRRPRLTPAPDGERLHSMAPRGRHHSAVVTGRGLSPRVAVRTGDAPQGRVPLRAAQPGLTSTQPRRAGPTFGCQSMQDVYPCVHGVLQPPRTHGYLALRGASPGLAGRLLRPGPGRREEGPWPLFKMCRLSLLLVRPTGIDARVAHHEDGRVTGSAAHAESPAISIDAAESVEEILSCTILVPGRIRNIVGKPQLGYAIAHFEIGIELDVDFHSHYPSRRAHLAPFYISLSRPSSIDLSAIR